jgi:AraC-like DNA-binding protein
MKNEVYGFLNMEEMAPSPLRLLDFGIEYRQKERYDFHNGERGGYEGYLFQFTIDGYGYFEENEKTEVLDKGRAFFITFPSQSRYYLPQEADRWHYFYIHFAGPTADYFYDYLSNREGKVLNLPKDASCIKVFMKEFQAISNGKKYDKYESGEFLYRFLTCLCKDVEKSTQSGRNSIADRVKEWIQNNYMTGKNISDMSEELGISTAHITRQFHSANEMPPVQYLNKLRVEHTAFLLINTDLSLEKIAEQSGFANGNYCSKVFRKAVGVEPSKYRESFQLKE